MARRRRRLTGAVRCSAMAVSLPGAGFLGLSFLNKARGATARANTPPRLLCPAASEFLGHARWYCQINVCRAEGATGGIRDHAAATVFLHWFAASARKIRSVERETRWRWRLKVLWTAACMLRNRWAERAATLEVYFKGHATTARRRFAGRELGGPGARLTRRLSAA
jgi:hypothetical protein